MREILERMEVGGQYGDVSTLKVREQHFYFHQAAFCQVRGDRAAPATTEAIYITCPAHKTLAPNQGGRA